MLIQTGCSVFGLRSEEEIKYKVLLEDGDFEIRQYESYIQAKTNIDRRYSGSSREGFQRLFDYITGNNQLEKEITMTAPVILNPNESKPIQKSERIAMTAPVMVSPKESGWQFAFVLPKKFTLGTTPKPLDPRITISQVPEKIIAVYRFTGLLGEDTFQENKRILDAWLTEKNYQSISMTRMAGFDRPWTLPFLGRNEMMTEISFSTLYCKTKKL